MKPSSIAVRVWVVAGLMLVTAAYLSAAFREEAIPPRIPLAQLPFTLGEFRGQDGERLTDDIIAILGVDEYLVRTYAKPASVPVGLYVGYHETQRQGDTIHSPLNCLPGAGWLPLEVGRLSVPVDGALDGSGAMEVNRVVIGKGLDRQVVLYWYQSHRRVVAGEYIGKVYTVLDAVRYNRTDAALVRITAPYGRGEDGTAAEKRAVEFVQAMFPKLVTHFPE